MLGKKTKKILVVSHEASYTGAPLLLIQLIKFIKLNYNYSVQIVIIRGGPLEKEFEQYGSVTILKDAGYSSRRGVSRLKSILINRIKNIKTFYFAINSDFIFCNSIICGNIIGWLRFSRTPIYTYVHELEQVIRMYLNSGHIRPALKYSTSLFYPCKRVQETLIDCFHVPVSKLFRLNYYFPAHYFENNLLTACPANNEFLYCGVGTASYRKGTDLFIDVAKMIYEKSLGYKFVWIGGFGSKEDEEKYRTMALVNGKSVVEFTGALEPPQVRLLYSKFDALLLTSREDPYPLVVLEAAYNKKASIVFKDSGGISEFVEGCGWVINQIASKEMAECLFKLNKDKLQARGVEAYEKVNRLHSNQQMLKDQLFIMS